MLVENIEVLEEQFYGQMQENVLPKLMCAYYEGGKYELLYYIASKQQEHYVEAEFYAMMSLADMGYYDMSLEIYERHRGEWQEIGRQYDIYWKHMAIFVLYFKEWNELSEHYEMIFDEYYDEVLIQLVELLPDIFEKEIERTEIYKKVSVRYPAMKDMWDERNALKRAAFEDIRWRYWEEYNREIKNGKKYGIEQVYTDENIVILSYRPKEVSASMHIIYDSTDAIILDCGCEMGEYGSERLPIEDIKGEYGLPDIKAVYISHAHKDHYGSLNEFRGIDVYMSEMTRDIIRLVSPEIILENANIKHEFTTSEDVPGVKVTFIPNGHIRGSVLMDIDWKGRRIVYTGDFSVDDQRTVEGLRVEDIILNSNKSVDVLITETTFGKKKGMLRLADHEKMLLDICEVYMKYGNKVLVQCFSLGGQQEITFLLADLVKRLGKKMMIDGSTVRATEYYHTLTGLNIINRNVAICTMDSESIEQMRENDLLLAGNGMLSGSTKATNIISDMIYNEKMCVIKIGYSPLAESMITSIKNRAGKNISYVDIPLSTHASHGEIIEMIEMLLPECVVYVHGAGILR